MQSDVEITMLLYIEISRTKTNCQCAKVNLNCNHTIQDGHNTLSSQLWFVGIGIVVHMIRSTIRIINLTKFCCFLIRFTSDSNKYYKNELIFLAIVHSCNL